MYFMKYEKGKFFKLKKKKKKKKKKECKIKLLLGQKIEEEKKIHRFS